MRKLVIATILLILGSSATAMADRGRDRGSRNDRRGSVQQRGNNYQRPVVRDRQVRQNYNRGNSNRGYTNSNRSYTNSNRGYTNRGYNRGYNRGIDRNYSSRRPVYINNGRYTFSNGRTFNYRRPVIQYRYTNYRVRPTILVENYDTVPGYVWVAGNWQWNGYEWTWISGHYAVDPSFQVGVDYNGY